MPSEDAIPANTNRIWPISHRVAMWRHFGLKQFGLVFRRLCALLAALPGRPRRMVMVHSQRKAQVVCRPTLRPILSRASRTQRSATRGRPLDRVRDRQAAVDSPTPGPSKGCA